MKYLGSERSITQDYITHGGAEDYSGVHKSEIKINGKGKVIKIINKFKSHEDSINYNTFLEKQSVWYSNGIYECISITGKNVKMSIDELGGNQVWIETYDDNNLIITAGKDGVIVDEQEFKKELSKLLDDFDNDEPTLVAPVKNATAKKIDLDEIYKNIYKAPVDASYTVDPYVVYPSSNGVDFKISLHIASYACSGFSTAAMNLVLSKENLFPHSSAL